MGILRTDKISGLETPTAVTGSVNFDGNDHLSIGSAGDFNFLHNGATDWTVEFWAKTGTATRQFVWGTGGSSAQTGFYLQIMSQADGQADATGVYALVGRGASGNYINWGANDCLTLNTWHHIAAVFKSSDKTLALYVDGREVDNDTGTVNGTFAAANYASGDSSYAFIVGKNIHGSGNFMNGEISNLRVVAGRRLYTSNFTPPVHALEPINGTRILCCNNPDSVTAVSNTDIGKGYTATASGDPTVATDNPSLTRDFTGGTEFNGVTTFDTQGYFVPPSGTTEQRGAGKAVFAGGYVPGGTITSTIESVNINSLGNATKFGTLKLNSSPTSTSSATRQLIAGGYLSPVVTDNIDYITISTSSDSVDFGTLGTARRDFDGLSNNTRSVFGGGTTTGSTTPTTNMEYVTSASLGNGTTFGTLTASGRGNAACASPTRGIFFGGYQAYTTPVSTYTNVINYITIATTGGGTDFGDLAADNSGKKGGHAAFSSSTRGVIAGGAIYGPDAPAYTPYDTIEYVTIASTGNAQDFGNLTGVNNYLSGTTNSTRGIFNQGTAPTYINTIQYVTIASTGNAQDFGDALNKYFAYNNSSSDSHGGLS